MNPVLVILILLAGALIWLLASFLFRPIGKISDKLVDDAKKAMFEEEKEKEDKVNE